MPNRFPWIAVLPALAAAAQGTRPQAAAFDMSQLHMEAPPPAAVAIRAGRLFDPKTGTNLVNQGL